MNVPNSRPIIKFASLADMQTGDTSGFETGDLCYVTESAAYFQLNIESEATADASTIFATANAVGGGAGRWIAFTSLLGGAKLSMIYDANNSTTSVIAVANTYYPVTTFGPNDYNIAPSTGSLLVRAVVSGSSTAACIVRIRLKYGEVEYGRASATVAAGGYFSIPVDALLEDVPVGVPLEDEIVLEWSSSAATTLTLSGFPDEMRSATLMASDVNVAVQA